ncbi:MAG: hypothetical protein GYA36_19070 [Veillonellaceae bacterium]|nr:hypothetical protein [Veillonellaceae bacterium]
MTRAKLVRPADMPDTYPWGWRDSWDTADAAEKQRILKTWEEIREIAIDRLLPESILRGYFLEKDDAKRAQMRAQFLVTRRSFLRKGWISPWSFRVRCSGQLHTISMDSRGRLHFHNHDRRELRRGLESGEKVMGKLGMRYGCRRVYQTWQRSFCRYWWGEWSSDFWMPRCAWKVVTDLRKRNGGWQRPKKPSMKGGVLDLIGICSLKEAHRRVVVKIINRLFRKTSKVEHSKIITFRREYYRYANNVEVDLGVKGRSPYVESRAKQKYRDMHIRVCLPLDWKRKVYDKGKSVLDSKLVLDVLEPKGRTGVGPGAVVLVAVGTSKGTQLFRHYRARVNPGGRTLTLLGPVKAGTKMKGKMAWVPQENDGVAMAAGPAFTLP